MGVYLCLGFLALGLATLVWGNAGPHDRRIHFGVAVLFVALAAVVMILSAIHSLWFYPLS